MANRDWWCERERASREFMLSAHFDDDDDDDDDDDNSALMLSIYFWEGGINNKEKNICSMKTFKL